MTADTNLAKLLAGLTLGEAFRNFILDDPEVIAHGKSAIEAEPLCRSVFEDAWFGGSSGKTWPAKYEKWDFAYRWCSVGVIIVDGPQEPPPPEAVQAAAEVLRNRYAELIGVFRNGKVIASGMSVNGSMVSSIPRALWSDEDVFIDFANSTVSGWKGVELSAPLNDIPEPQKNKGGAPPKYLWKPVFSRVALRLGKKGMPETGSELADWMLEAFDEEGDEAPEKDYVKTWLKINHPLLWKEAKKEERN